MAIKANKISARRIREIRDDFRAFRDGTNLADPEDVARVDPNISGHRDCAASIRKKIECMDQPEHAKIYRERSYNVESMQGLLKGLFECGGDGMRGG